MPKEQTRQPEDETRARPPLGRGSERTWPRHCALRPLGGPAGRGHPLPRPWGVRRVGGSELREHRRIQTQITTPKLSGGRNKETIKGREAGRRPLRSQSQWLTDGNGPHVLGKARVLSGGPTSGWVLLIKQSVRRQDLDRERGRLGAEMSGRLDHTARRHQSLHKKVPSRSCDQSDASVQEGTVTAVEGQSESRAGRPSCN